MRLDTLYDSPPIVRVVALLAIPLLVYIMVQPLTEANAGGLLYVGLAIVLGFVVGLLARSYWAVVIVPPCVVVALSISFLTQSAGFRDLLQGEYPVDRAIREGFHILFATGFLVVPAFYFLLTPPIVAGVWLGNRLLRRLSR